VGAGVEWQLRLCLGGGKNNVDGSFVPWFDYADGYNGYLFAPALTDIHIFNVVLSVKPYENTTLALQVYYYLKADGMASLEATRMLISRGCLSPEFGIRRFATSAGKSMGSLAMTTARMCGLNSFMVHSCRKVPIGRLARSAVAEGSPCGSQRQVLTATVRTLTEDPRSVGGLLFSPAWVARVCFDAPAWQKSGGGRDL